MILHGDIPVTERASGVEDIPGSVDVTMRFSLRGTSPADAEETAAEFIKWLESHSQYGGTDMKVRRIIWRSEVCSA